MTKGKKNGFKKHKKEVDIEKVCRRFMERHEKDLIQMAIQSRANHGPGVLIVDLDSQNREGGDGDSVDLKYYNLRSFPKELAELKKIIVENPKREVTLHFILTKGDFSITIEKELE